MTEKEYGKVIAKNLKRLAFEKGKTQADMARDLHISKQTVSSWMLGTRIPRMDKIDMLCEYFGCKRSDIMEPQAKSTTSDGLTLDEKMLLNQYRKLSDDEKEWILDVVTTRAKKKVIVSLEDQGIS